MRSKSTTLISKRLTIVRMGLARAAVMAWLGYPRRVFALAAASLYLSAAAVLWLVFRLVLISDRHALLALVVILTAICAFVFVIEPWFANTGLYFRGYHRHKLSCVASHDELDYLRLLHDRVSESDVRCNVSILGGQCPWLLAYGIEIVFNPANRSIITALALDLKNPEASKSEALSRRL